MPSIPEGVRNLFQTQSSQVDGKEANSKSGKTSDSQTVQSRTNWVVGKIMGFKSKISSKLISAKRSSIPPSDRSNRKRGRLSMGAHRLAGIVKGTSRDKTTSGWGSDFKSFYCPHFKAITDIVRDGGGKEGVEQYLAENGIDGKEFFEDMQLNLDNWTGGTADNPTLYSDEKREVLGDFGLEPRGIAQDSRILLRALTEGRDLKPDSLSGGHVQEQESSTASRESEGVDTHRQEAVQKLSQEIVMDHAPRFKGMLDLFQQGESVDTIREFISRTSADQRSTDTLEGFLDQMEYDLHLATSGNEGISRQTNEMLEEYGLDVSSVKENIGHIRSALNEGKEVETGALAKSGDSGSVSSREAKSRLSELKQEYLDLRKEIKEVGADNIDANSDLEARIEAFNKKYSDTELEFIDQRTDEISGGGDFTAADMEQANSEFQEMMSDFPKGFGQVILDMKEEEAAVDVQEVDAQKSEALSKPDDSGSVSAKDAARSQLKEIKQEYEELRREIKKVGRDNIDRHPDLKSRIVKLNKQYEDIMFGFMGKRIDEIRDGGDVSKTVSDQAASEFKGMASGLRGVLPRSFSREFIPMARSMR